MVDRESTRWSLIRRAAEGGTSEREEFARVYEPTIRLFLSSRWRRPPLTGQIDDATQEVFLACFDERNPLHRADPSGPAGFRGYLYGIVRNVARRFEEKSARTDRRTPMPEDLELIEADDDSPSRLFDRAWAKAILKGAVRLQAERAAAIDEAAVRRSELLRLRFQEGLPIREIATRWAADPAQVHRQYAKARREFAAALQDVVRDHLAGSPADINAECARLVQFLR